MQYLNASAWVAELADAPDLKTPFSAFSITSETYQKLPKISFNRQTGMASLTDTAIENAGLSVNRA